MGRVEPRSGSGWGERLHFAGRFDPHPFACGDRPPRKGEVGAASTLSYMFEIDLSQRLDAGDEGVEMVGGRLVNVMIEDSRVVARANLVQPMLDPFVGLIRLSQSRVSTFHRIVR